MLEPCHAKELRRLEAVCRERALPLTSQRRIVFEVLLERSDHPTADQVHEAARARLPRISRRTVYRILDALVEFGLIRRVHHPQSTARFDAVVLRHHHLICTRCGKIVDWSDPVLDGVSLPAGQPRGFEIHDFSVQFTGVCPDCRKEGAPLTHGRKRHE